MLSIIDSRCSDLIHGSLAAIPPLTEHARRLAFFGTRRPPRFEAARTHSTCARAHV